MTERPPVVAVAYCRNCEHYLEAAEIGSLCPVGYPDCTSIMVKRVGIICPLDGCADEGTIVLTRRAPARKWREHLEEHGVRNGNEYGL